MFLDCDPRDLEFLDIRPHVTKDGKLVTKQMREAFFDTHGMYADDTSVYNWYWSRDVEKPTEPQRNKYQREIKPKVFVDVYDVLKAFNVTNPATQHAIKKLLAGGKRGHKDLLQDLNEAHSSISRAIELELE